jgi:hypothetical protein
MKLERRQFLRLASGAVVLPTVSSATKVYAMQRGGVPVISGERNILIPEHVAEPGRIFIEYRGHREHKPSGFIRSTEADLGQFTAVSSRAPGAGARDFVERLRFAGTSNFWYESDDFVPSPVEYLVEGYTTRDPDKGALVAVFRYPLGILFWFHFRNSSVDCDPRNPKDYNNNVSEIWIPLQKEDYS